MSQLASAGETVKLWDTPNYSLNHEYNPQTVTVSDISWSYDGQFLASASANGDKLMVALVNLENFNICEVSAKNDQHCTCFSRNTSRHLLSGGTSGEILLWDLKLHQVKKTYMGHLAPVTKVQFNWNDTTILSGSARGDVVLHNVMTGLGSSPLRPPKIQAIRDLKYSFTKRSLFATASDDGIINLWDANSRNMLHSFKEAHNAPAMALAFSPVNEMLLASVGLDKKVICFDVKTKTPVKTLVSDQPFTSMDFLHDGVTLAVGSTRGKISIYDLRQSTTPMRTFTAHKNSIHCLSYQTIKLASAKSQGASNANRSASLSPKRLLGSHPMSASSSSLAASVSQIPQLANKLTIKRCFEFNGKNNNDVLNQTPPDFFRSRNLSDDIFSPLQKDSSVERLASIRKQPIGAGNSNHSFGDRPITAGLDDSETVNPLNISLAESVTRSLSPPPAPRRRSASFSPRTSRNINQERAKDVCNLSTTTVSTAADHNVVINFLETNVSSSKLLVRQIPQKENSVPTSPDSILPVTVEGVIPHMIGLSQEKGVKNDVRRLIEDSVEELHELINKKYQQLRIDMIKEFQIQKSEIEALLQRYSINEDLVSENERLREENRRLQSKF